ncbi:MAG: SurA N-terminal domain-containing protein [Candidatus Lambdaproteobacteria bacterium]|nr:SurA N-terminal domain-containing protein [Candidatus Lambdaproteobacteria bacterium]
MVGRGGGWGRLEPLLLVLLLLLAPLAGCDGALRRKGGMQQEAPALATVNNERIGVEEFQRAYARGLTQWERLIGGDEKKRDALKPIVLNQLIDSMLLDQEARRKGISVDDAAVQAEVQRLIQPMDDESFKLAAQQAGQSIPEWSRTIRRRLIHRKLIQAEVIDKIRITPRELRAYYERNQPEFRQAEQVRVRHIAVNSKAQYDKVQRLLERKGDFTQLAREHSITPDRMNDGDLGYVERGVLPPEFDQAIFRMTQIGSISPARRPVQTQLGYHIFRLEGRRQAMLLPFDDAVPRIRQVLAQRKQAEQYRTWLESLRELATVRIDQELLNGIKRG